ncbi:MAG: ABC transporter permease [Thermoleophilia bacterium]
MITTPERALSEPLSGNGGLAARRALVRWAWRLFRREWRQQLLVVALVVVAVAATVVGATVAADTPPAANAGFGSAQDLATLAGSDAHLSAEIASLQRRFGRLDVIENETLAIPGSIDTYDLRAQNPRGPYGQPMLALISGHFPKQANQVAVTSGVASAFNLRVGDVWRQGGPARMVVGIVENPQSLLDEFALVVPGQVKVPTQVTVLFDAPGVAPASLGANVATPLSASSSNAFNSETISIAGLTLGMLLIALVAVAAFTVLAQRRLRSLGMLASLGATDRNVRLVVRANGVVVGVVGAAIGFAVGLIAWLAYRPSLQTSAHHVIGVFALPWLVIVLAMLLAVLATYVAASRPARAVSRVPIVAALSGRPIPPKQVHHSALPGIVFLVIAFLLLSYSGSASGAKPRVPELVLGLAALIPALILLSPFCLAALAKLGKHAPLAVRIAVRDLSRYRARSGAALAAISLAVLIAVVIVIVAAARYGNVLDYAGPNLASNQLAVYTPYGPGYTPPNLNPASPDPGTRVVTPKGITPHAIGTVTAKQLKAMNKSAHEIASSLGSGDVIELDSTSASLYHAGAGRPFVGPVYVATPSLLRAFGIKASQVDPTAEILTMRPGLSGLSAKLTYGNGNNSPALANPVIEEVSALPAGTSAPNTVITEYAVHKLGLGIETSGWLIQTAQPLTALQINSSRLAASAANMTVESKSSAPSSAEIINWVTVFGIVLALAILALTIGLIRSETAGDLRTLAATGASSTTRRTLTAATAGALALLGALLGTVAGYVGVIGWIRSNSLNGGIAALGHVPIVNLLVILIGLPVAAAAGGWLLAGREPPAIARQPLE